MEFWDSPIVHGSIGAAIASLLCGAVSRWVPGVCNGKPARVLIRQNRVAIYLSNILFFVGLFGPIFGYMFGYVSRFEWWPLALGAGLGTLAPLVVLLLWAAVAGLPTKEVFVAYAISQKFPMVIVYGVFVFGFVCLAIGVIGLAGL